MTGTSWRAGAVSAVGAVAVALVAFRAPAEARVEALPAAVQARGLASHPDEEVAVFAGGCFWGVQWVFEHVKGVKSAVSGFAGGKASAPSYEQVSTGATGHAESVRVVFDPSQVTYGQLLQIFFSVAHDPTQLNRQGPDVGTQYRSAIFYTSEQQRREAQAYIAQLTGSKAFSRPIVTQVARLDGFFPAEAYHQDYAVRHPNQPYIMINDAPKVAHLKKQFPSLYREYEGQATADAGK